MLMGEISSSATLVAIKEAPQTITANNASAWGKSFELDMDIPEKIWSIIRLHSF
jgi:hypothetical protein